MSRNLRRILSLFLVFGLNVSSIAPILAVQADTAKQEKKEKSQRSKKSQLSVVVKKFFAIMKKPLIEVEWLGKKIYEFPGIETAHAKGCELVGIDDLFDTIGGIPPKAAEEIGGVEGEVVNRALRPWAKELKTPLLRGYWVRKLFKSTVKFYALKAQYQENSSVLLTGAQKEANAKIKLLQNILFYGADIVFFSGPAKTFSNYIYGNISNGVFSEFGKDTWSRYIVDKYAKEFFSLAGRRLGVL